MSKQCGHIFCKDCISNRLHHHLADNDEVSLRLNEYSLTIELTSQQFNTCPTCDKVFENVTPVQSKDGVEDNNPPTAGSQSKSSNSKRAKTRHSKGEDMMGFEPKTKDSSWVSQSDYDDDFPLAPSAKTTALKGMLIEGFTAAPWEKVGYKSFL